MILAELPKSLAPRRWASRTSLSPVPEDGEKAGARADCPDMCGVADLLEDVQLVEPETLMLYEKVGTGSTAQVYRGCWDGREVAVKHINLRFSRMSQKEKQCLAREISVMKTVRHPNLVHLLGVSFQQSPIRILTEFCEGGSLFDLLHNCEQVELRWPQQVKIAIDVAEAMAYLHANTPQIIHRDLKSLNLLLEEALTPFRVPTVKVCDFGLARMKDQMPRAEWGTMTQSVGTCPWMAPEVLTGQNYDEKVDVYSYAMILFEVICREIPFEEEEEPAAVCRHVLAGQRPDLDAVPPDCPQLLQDLMVACWAHRPRSRPAFESVLPVLYVVRDLMPRSMGKPA